MEEDFTLQRLYRQNKIQQKQIKKLKARIEALEQLLVCYRVGKNPSEKLHKMLEKTKQELGDA